MDFELPDEIKAVKRLARDFAEKEIRPHVDEWDKTGHFPVDVVKKMAGQGFFGAAFPPEYGGSGMGFLAHTVICEEISRVDSSLRALFNIQGLTCPLTILNWGTEGQKKKYVKRLINCEIFGVNAMTEPGAGSDFASIRSKAELRGDEYILNGSKIFISNAPIMDAGVVYVKTNPREKHRGISCLIVERDMPGLSVREIKEKVGQRASPLGEIIFEDCRVPRDNLVGEEGKGFKIAMTQLDLGRLSVGAGALGVARACLEESVRYCNERVAFGKKIGAFQMNQKKLAEMVVEIEAARLLLYRAAWLADKERRQTLESSMAKHLAAEACIIASRYAMEIFGGYGYSEEYPVAKLYRDAIMYQTGEGSSNITAMIIALDALGWKKANG